MKNTLLAIALASAGFLALPAAQAADNHSGLFINGGVGQSSIDRGAYDDDDTAFNANIGYRWAVSPNVLLGVEGGYTDFGSISPGRYDAVLGKAEISGWNLGVNGHFNVADNWYVSARGGLFRGDVKAGYYGVPVVGEEIPVYRIDDTSNKWYAGAGFGYDFSSNFSLGLNYDTYRAEEAGMKFSPDMVSVSGEYRF